MQHSNNSTVVYPGTFDPITRGHEDIINRASKIFNKVIIAIAAVSTGKQFSFAIDRRVELAKNALAGNPAVEVVAFEGLLVDFIASRETNLILRGLRAVSDFEHEFQLANMNRKLSPDLETIFLTPSEQFTYISSSLVKEIARLGGNVEQFVSMDIANALASLR